MRIKNAFRVLIGNAGVIYKAIFFRLIVASVIGIIGYFTLFEMLRPVILAEESKALWQAVLDLFLNPLRGNNASVSPELVKCFEAFRALVKAELPAVKGALIGTFLFVVLYDLVVRMGDYAFTYLYDGFMSAQTRYGFCSTLILKFGKAFLYAVIAALVTSLYDFLVITAATYMVVYGVEFISVFAVILTLIFVVFAFALKFTLLSHFLPRVVTEDEHVLQAFARMYRGRFDFVTLLGNYAFLIMISFYINVSACVLTVGAGLMVTIPLTSMAFLLVALVDYYNSSNRKFYVAPGMVEVPEQLNENADLLKYM